MADDNQNSGGDGCSKSILWGLSFGVVSAIAFKTMSALFPGRTTEQNPAQVININGPPISSIDDTPWFKLQTRVPFHKLIVMHNDCKSSIWNEKCEAYYDEIKKLCLGSAVGPTPSDIGRSLLLESFNGCKSSIWNEKCEAYYDEIKKLCLGSAVGPTPSDIGRSLLLESFNGCMFKARSSDKEQSACWETYSKLMPTK